MDIVVHSSTDAPINEVASDLSAHGIVVYAVPTSLEAPPLNVRLDGELGKSGSRVPNVIHYQVTLSDARWFDCYSYGVVAGFDLKTAPNLVERALRLWQEAGKRPRCVVQLNELGEMDEA